MSGGDDEDDDRDGHGSDVALADGRELGRQAAHAHAARRAHDDAARHAEHAQRGDEGRQTEALDEEAVDEADDGAGGDAQEDGDGDGQPPPVHGDGGDEATEGHDRGDREIDAADEQHERHAHRADADVRVVPGDVHDVLDRQEAREHDRHVGAEDDDDEQDAGLGASSHGTDRPGDRVPRRRRRSLRCRPCALASRRPMGRP